jgi:predicted ArsR family transcriptional regulator
LAQPTRARLYELLNEFDRPLTTDELAQRLELHPNGVRAHLSRLEQAGLVVRERMRHGPGRPRDGWSTTVAGRASAPPRAYENLAMWLASAIEPKPARLREVEGAGRDIGRRLAAEEHGARGLAALETAMAAHGFRPSARPRKRGDVELCLGNCPYADAVRANQPVVCALHRGMTAGLVELLTPELDLAGFAPADPERAGCLVELSPSVTGSARSTPR